MKLTEVLRVITSEKESNFFVEAPDQIGLVALLPKVLEGVAATEDIHVVDASTITKEKARQLEKEARYAPRGSSEKTHFILYSMQNLPVQSVGPLLKVVEESRYARWVFQAQGSTKKLETLKSRAWGLKVAFLTKKAVLGNLQRMNLDAEAVEQSNTYDGTLTGTARALAMKDSLVSTRRAIMDGIRGLTTLYHPDTMKSLALMPAVDGNLTPKERRFLNRDGSEERKKVVLWLVTSRL